jgi:hypothetical protein
MRHALLLTARGLSRIVLAALDRRRRLTDESTYGPQ